MNRRLRDIALTMVCGVVLIIPTAVQAQNLLTNGGLETTVPASGRHSVPPGWQVDEGPNVPELPPGPRPATWTPLSNPWPYEGDYNNTRAGDITCDDFKCIVVDAADYTVWRNNLGTDFALPNRRPGIGGNVQQFDYDIWKLNYNSLNAMSLTEPSDFDHLAWEGEWQMWFQPYNSTRTGNAGAIADNWAHFYQDVPGTPGLEYTMSGYALFENYFPGGVTHLNAANPDGTGTGAPFDDGPLSPTDTYFALEFLDANDDVIGGEEIELMANGQLANTVWKQHTISAIAPIGTVEVRVRASMINGISNPLPNPQAFQMSFFVDDFSLTASTPGAGGITAVPEPTSAFLATLAFFGLLGSTGRRFMRW